MKKPTRTPLNAEQLADAKRLSDIYKARARESKLRGDVPALTQTEVGEQCGWNSPQSTVSQYMNGKVALNVDALIKLARVLKFDPCQVSPTLGSGLALIGEEIRVLSPQEIVLRALRAGDTSGPTSDIVPPDYEALDIPQMIQRDSGSELEYPRSGGASPLPADGDIEEDRYEFIPQYTAMAAAGDGHENPHVEIHSTLAFKKEWLRMKGVKAENLQVIYANGESMWPTINDHDVLLVDSSKFEPVDDGVFVLQSATEGTIVKRLVQMPLGDWIMRSDNADKEAYGDRYFLRVEQNEHRIIGRVIWRGGDL